MENNENVKHHRIAWVDAAKGMGMLLVIIGHTITNEFALQLIYSFHMPMFFIATALTMRNCTSAHEYFCFAKKNFVRLIPIGIVLTILNLYCRNFDFNDGINSLLSLSLTLLFQRGNEITLSNGNVIIAMGLPWFLFCLYHSKLLVWLFDLMFERKNTLEKINNNDNARIIWGGAIYN